MTENARTRVRGHCPRCGADRYADVVGHYVDVFDPWGGAVGPPNYRILRCRGCEAVYFQIQIEVEGVVKDPHTGEETRRSRVVQWPAPEKRKPPVWLPSLAADHDLDLAELLGDVYTALDNNLAVLAAIGIRTVFDRASELLGIDPELPFARKLDMLAASGKIAADERLSLAVLTDAGGAAAHRGWRPSAGELATMMDIIEAFIHRSFVLGEAVAQLKSGVPARRKRGSGQTK